MYFHTMKSAIKYYKWQEIGLIVFFVEKSACGKGLRQL